MCNQFIYIALVLSTVGVCTTPASPDNGAIDTATPIEFTYSCNLPYIVEDGASATITCQTNGLWNDIPTCVRGQYNVASVHTGVPCHTLLTMELALQSPARPTDCGMIFQHVSEVGIMLRLYILMSHTLLTMELALQSPPGQRTVE